MSGALACLVAVLLVWAWNKPESAGKWAAEAVQAYRRAMGAQGGGDGP